MPMPSFSKLVRNLYKKRDLLRNKDSRHKNIRTALIILGGGMRGAAGGGAVNALHSLGFGDVFDVVVGISTGAPTAAYYLAGKEQAALGASIYYEDLPSRFIKYGRTPVMDIDFMESLFRNGRKKLDVGAVRSRRSEFFIAATDAEKGGGVLLDAKKVPDMITALKASTAVIGLYGKEIDVGGRRYVDGVVSDPFPIKKIISDFNPTDLLVIANQSGRALKKNGRSFIERILERFISIKIPEHLRQSFFKRHFHYREAFNCLESQNGFNAEILWAPDDSVHSLTRNASKIRAFAEKSAEQTLAFFKNNEQA